MKLQSLRRSASNGEADISSAVGEGTTVLAWVPRNAHEEAAVSKIF